MQSGDLLANLFLARNHFELMDQRTHTPSYRDERTHLKKKHFTPVMKEANPKTQRSPIVGLL